MRKPNIIFYFSDQQRHDTMGCYGQKINVTPVLDDLAEKGTLFMNAFTCQPVCGPARAALQTGKYPTEVGCFTNNRMLPLSEKTIAKYFNDAGYDTAYVGKWHLASQGPDVNYETTAIPEAYRGGYKDYWMASDILEFTSRGYNGYVHDINNKKHEFIGYRADCINNYAIDFVRNHSGENPFFLFVSQVEPHHQNDRNCHQGPDGSKEKYKNFEVPEDLAGADGDWQLEYPDYLGCCNRLDYNVGRLIDTLKAKGIYEDTVIIYTSDHGSHFKTRNSEYKRSCHDSSIRIPMIVHGPGFMGGGKVESLVSLIDVPTTLLDVGGIKIPDDFKGKSLKSLAKNPNMPWRDSVMVQISESQIGRAIRTQKWKYSVRADGDGWLLPNSEIYYEDFLYDLENDPHERTNLVTCAAHAKTRAELERMLLENLQIANEPPAKILSCK